MWLFNTAMSLLFLGSVIFHYKKNDWIDQSSIAENIDNNLLTFLLLLNTLVLAVSVIKIRKRIQSLHNAFPNEKFIAIHVINSIIYTVLYFVLGIMIILQNAKLQENSEDGPTPELELELLKIFYFYELIYMIMLVFQIYMDCFLLYLILRFTNSSTRGTEQDEVLGRQVPSILFIQN